MAKRSTPMRKDTDTEASPPDVCEDCTSPDPQIRARHHLFLAREGMARLERHLWQYFGLTIQDTTRHADDVKSLCRWVSDIMAQWTGFPDPQTGAPLPWWEARRQMAQRKEAIAHDAHEQAPKKYREGLGKRRTVVVSTSPAVESVGTILVRAEPLQARAPVPQDEWPELQGDSRCRQCGVLLGEDWQTLCDECAGEEEHG